MSLAVQKADSSQSIHSFAAALQQLAARDGQLTPPLEAFLTSNSSKLAACAQPFSSPSASSRSSVDGGSFSTQSGESVKLGEKEKEVVKQLSDRLQIDEVDAAVLLRSYRRGKGENTSNDLDASLCRSDEFWEQVTVFVLEEQLRVIETVALLLRSADFEARVPAEVVQRFASDVTTPQFAQTLLNRVTYLATTSIPTSAIPFSPLWAKFWVQQQKALLEVYFLLYYNRLFPNGKSLLSVLKFVESTVWGSLQTNEGLFDSEAQALAQDVVALCHLVLIENMNLERSASSEAEEFNLVPGQQLSEDDILHPKTLQDLHQRVLHLIGTHPRQSALLALAWAAVLFRITESISSVPLPETYYDVAQEILPSDLQPRKEKRTTQANTSPQALWQLLVTHALSPQVSSLSFMANLLSLPILSANISISWPTPPSTDPNVAGYLSVLRSVLASVARLVHPSYLPAEDFDNLVTVFEALYSNPDAGLLRGNFWGLFAEMDENPIREEEWQIFDVAAKRFPVEVDHFSRMVLAVSGGRSTQLLSSPIQLKTEDETAILANSCAEQVTQYLGQPQSLTQALPAISPVMPLPYEPARSIQAGPADIVSTRPIKISPSVTIPPGTAGRVVSPFDQRPLIVCWDLSRVKNAPMPVFTFYGDCLKAFATESPGKRPSAPSAARDSIKDVFESSDNQGFPENFLLVARDTSALANMVAILRNVIQNSPRKTSAILQAAFGDAKVAVSILVAILDKTAFSETAQTLSVVTTNLLTVLLASYPDEIWLQLRSSDTLFPLEKSSSAPIWGSRNGSHNKNVLAQDKIKGSYERTLACLELVQGLVMQAQWTLDTDTPVQVKSKAPVLKRALHWTLVSVWTNYTSWKYRDVRQRFELGSRLAAILGDVLHEATFETRGSLAAAIDLVLEALLIKPGHAQMSALLNTIITGNDTLASLQRLGKTVDCSVVESCIHQHLRLSNHLLQLSRRVFPAGPTLVERLLFAHDNEPLYRAVVPEASADPIYALSTYIVNSSQVPIAIEAVRILIKLCTLGADWGSSSDRPSLLSHLGSIQETETLLRKLHQLAGDPFVDSELQLSIWRLLSAIAAHQPGFASLLITGRQPVADFEQVSALDTSQSATITGLALEVIRGWEEAWEVQPSLLNTALTFLTNIWENYLNSSKTLQSIRQQDFIWSSLLKIVERDLVLEPTQEIDSDEGKLREIEYACRCHARAAASLLYALDLSFANQTSEGSQGTSVKAFIKFVGDHNRLKQCCTNAVHQSFDQERIEQVKQQLSSAFSPLNVDKYIHIRTLDYAIYGRDFYYDISILEKRLVGFVDITKPHSAKAAANASRNLRESNALWSLGDSEAAFLKSVVKWLQIGLSVSPKNKQISTAVETSCKALLVDIRDREDSTATAEAHYAGSLQLLQLLIQHLVGAEVVISVELGASLLSSAASYLANQTFSVLDGLQKEGVHYPQILLQLTSDIFKLESPLQAGAVAKRKQSDSKRAELAEMCLQSCIKACNSVVLLTPEGRPTQAAHQNLAAAVSAISDILASPLCPPTSSWLVCCSQMDFFRHILDMISSSPFEPGNHPSIKHALELLLSMAKAPEAAEKLALDGAIFSLCNNAMTGDLESGSVASLTSSAGERSHSGHHDIWLLFLSIVTQLACHLGTSIPFMDQELATFLQIYSAQLHRCLRWTPDRPLSIADLKEHRAVLTLIATCVRSSSGATHLRGLVQDLLRGSLGLLPQLVYLLQHPNLLLSLVEPSSPSQSSWLASDSDKSDTVDLGDFHSHPVVATLTQEVLSLCWLTVSTIIAYSEAFVVLLRDRVDWPKDRVLIAATANVSLDEPASLGTLFDLARFCIDVTRHCTANVTATQEGCPLQAYDVTLMRQIAEQCCEGTLLLMSTQIGLTVQQQDIAGSDDRASQRARRDLKELASDLVEEFLDRKSGQQSNEKKLLDVLKSFVLNL